MSITHNPPGGPAGSSCLDPCSLLRAYHKNFLLYFKHLHYFVAQVVDDLDGDAAGGGLVEGAGQVTVQGGPRVGVDLGLQGGLQRPVGVVRAEEVGVADEEALLVVVGVDEPAGDALGAVAAYLAGVGVEHVHAVDPDLEATRVVALGREDVDVRLAEDDEEVALAGVLQVLGHVEVGVHPRLEHRDAAELVELRGVGVVVERAGDEHVEIGVARLAGGGDEVGPRDGAELGADEDAGALLPAPAALAAVAVRVALAVPVALIPRVAPATPVVTPVALHVPAFGADPAAGPRDQGVEGDPVVLVGLLHAGGLELLQDHGGEVGPLAVGGAGAPPRGP